MSDESKCPFPGGARKPTTVQGTANAAWWPEQLNLKTLHQHSSLSSLMDAEFDYAEQFKTLALDAVIADLQGLMTDSQAWWPADYGHYGPFFIRMAWHAAGVRAPARNASRRSTAGPTTATSTRRDACRGRSSRSTAASCRGPICSSSPATSRSNRWGSRLSASAAAARTSGSRKKTTGVPRRRGWASTSATPVTRELASPLGATTMGLIYVNPEGPEGQPDPLGSARDIRETFARMAMNDEETVALTAGGHTFGKTHGAANPDEYVGVEPEGASIEEQGLGWTNRFGSGKGGHTITSGLEGAWTWPTRRSRAASWPTRTSSQSVRPRVVQADAPRHGPDRPLPRPARAEGRTDLAGPGAGRRSPAGQRAGCGRAEGEDPRGRPDDLAAGHDGVGIGLDLPWQRQARRRQRRAHPPGAAEGLGGQPAGGAGEGSEQAGRHSEGVQRRAARRQEGSRWPT